MTPTFGSRLRACRKSKKLSQRGLGLLAGLSGSAVRLLENGERLDPASSSLVSLAGALETTAEYLFKGVGPEPTYLAKPKVRSSPVRKQAPTVSTSPPAERRAAS